MPTKKTKLPALPPIPLTHGVTVIEPGAIYGVTGDTISFMHHDAGQKIIDGTTNEQMLVVMINRVEFQNDKLQCFENDAALWHLQEALKMFEKRGDLRKQQMLVNQEVKHVS
jgi:hypothetical protein